MKPTYVEDNTEDIKKRIDLQEALMVAVLHRIDVLEKTNKFTRKDFMAQLDMLMELNS